MKKQDLINLGFEPMPQDRFIINTKKGEMIISLDNNKIYLNYINAHYMGVHEIVNIDKLIQWVKAVTA